MSPLHIGLKGLQSAIFDGINLEVREGEIVGLAGLVGSGRSRLARTLFGAETILAGEITVSGKPVRINTVRGAMNAGISMLPESRKGQGLLLKQSVQLNITLPHLNLLTTLGGIIKRRTETDETAKLITAVHVQPPNAANKVNSLSGGNQQKVLFAKLWLLPFYPSPLRDDGYDITNYHDIHPDYGTLDDFQYFLEELHKRQLRVIIELVINHTSNQHPWFQAACKALPGSVERNFYVWSDR